MIAAYAIPAVKPEHTRAVAGTEVPAEGEESRPLRLANSLPVPDVRRFHNNEILLSIAATLGLRSATFTLRACGASGGAGRSQP